MKPRPLPIEPTEEEIGHAAYFLWEAEGKPVGRDRDIWFAARERLRHRRLYPAPSRRRPRREPAHAAPPEAAAAR